MTPRRGDYILALISLLLATLLAGPGSVLAETRSHPLEPLDTSSPRATLSSFLADVDAVWQIYRDEYWHAPSAELYTRINHLAARALRTLDLSQVAPSARVEVGYDAGTFLYETLNRIELPPLPAGPAVLCRGIAPLYHIVCQSLRVLGVHRAGHLEQHSEHFH